MQQIRITRTNDLDNVLSYLKHRYPLLSEAEIIKMALSNQYHRETQGEEAKRSDEIPNEYFKQELQKAREHRKKGNASPVFSSTEKMKAWLEKQGV